VGFHCNTIIPELKSGHQLLYSGNENSLFLVDIQG